MKNYIPVQFFYDLTELALARTQLEQAGIETMTRDEQTMQTLGMFEARSIGGAKLLVHQNDYVRASQLLIEVGLLNRDDQPQDFLLINKLDAIAKTFPIINTLPKEFRLIFIGVLLIGIPLVFLLFML